MSQNIIEQLFTRATSDPALFEQLTGAEDVDAIIEIGKDNGFEFSKDDLPATYSRFQPYGLVQREWSMQKRQTDAPAAEVHARPDGETDISSENGSGTDFFWLSHVKVRNFSVSPTQIRPKSGGATISWSLETPPGLGVAFSLDGVPVESEGSMHVDPVGTQVYYLYGSLLSPPLVIEKVVLNVDNSDCELDRFADLPALQQLAAHSVFETQGYKNGVSYDVSGFTATATMDSIHDLTFTEENGSVVVTLKLSLTVAGFGGGDIVSKVWIKPFAHNGAIRHWIDRSDTSYSLPAGVWVLAVFGGPTWLAIWAAFQKLIAEKIDPTVSKAADDGFKMIDAIFTNVISVVVEPEIPDGHDARLHAVTRKPECS